MLNWKLNSKQKLLIWGLQFLIIISALLYQQVNNPLVLNADLLSLFDTQSVSKFDRITKKIESKNLNQQIILVGASDIKKAIIEAKRLTQQLNHSPFITQAITEFPSAPNLENIVEDYLPYRHSFLSSRFRDILSNADSNEIFTYQFSLLNQMANPAVSLTIENDPTLSLADFFSLKTISNNGLSVHNNHLVVQHQDQHFVLVSFTPDAGT